jgi:hypothetical protein
VFGLVWFGLVWWFVDPVTYMKVIPQIGGTEVIHKIPRSG